MTPHAISPRATFELQRQGPNAQALRYCPRSAEQPSPFPANAPTCSARLLQRDGSKCVCTLLRRYSNGNLADGSRGNSYLSYHRPVPVAGVLLCGEALFQSLFKLQLHRTSHNVQWPRERSGWVLSRKRRTGACLPSFNDPSTTCMRTCRATQGVHRMPRKKNSLANHPSQLHLKTYPCVQTILTYPPVRRTTQQHHSRCRANFVAPI